MNALQILQKLRKYELEKDEHQLMLRHQDVRLCRNALEVAQVKLQTDLKDKESFQSSSLLKHLEAHFWESEENLKVRDLEHAKSIEERDTQIQKTLISKQRLDMIARVIEHRRETELAEEDQVERKFLDDISQTRYAMGISK